MPVNTAALKTFALAMRRQLLPRWGQSARTDHESDRGSEIEGEWEPVFAAIEACHQAVHAMGCPRVYTTETINTRTDKEQTLEDKVASVQAQPLSLRAVDLAWLAEPEQARRQFWLMPLMHCRLPHRNTVLSRLPRCAPRDRGSAPAAAGRRQPLRGSLRLQGDAPR